VAVPKSPIEGVSYLALFTTNSCLIPLREIHAAEQVLQARGRTPGTETQSGFGKVKRACAGLMNVPLPWRELGAGHSLAEVLHQHQVRPRPGANAEKNQALVRGDR
jgi:hypothetical protein